MFWEFLIAASPIALFAGGCGMFTVLPRVMRSISIQYNKLTGGKHSVDYESMQMIIHSLREFPTDWKIDAVSAQFPKEGSYRIAIQYDPVNRSNESMTVSIPSDSSGGRFKLVSPFFQYEISKILKATSTKQMYDTVQRTLFPDGSPLMLAGGR